MKIKNYEWNGFGFPIIFDELPAIKMKGELVPDVDWAEVATPLIQFICTSQDLPFSGNQIKFIRHHLNMTLREFATFVGVTHQSVMRWEEREKSSAHIDENTEIIFRIKILKKLHSDKGTINKIIEKVGESSNLGKLANYKAFKPLRVPESVIENCF